MSEPFSTPIMIKLLSGIGGLIGGASFMAFYKPKNVWDAAIRAGLSTTTSIVFSPIALDWFSFEHTMNNVLGSSVVIGFCSWSLLSLFARLLIDIQDERVRIKLPDYLERKK